MKRLILMRHAKSDWSAGAGSDHDRVLNGRGRSNAKALGDWLRREGFLPDEVLCSSALRTRETLVRLDLPEAAKVTYSRDLYLATHHDIMQAIRQAQGDCLLVIGHNPGMSIVATEILDEMPQDPDFQHYPTGATLVADLEIETWSQADWGNANARHFVVPRAL
jgi:phosphohistidine phosphatase